MHFLLFVWCALFAISCQLDYEFTLLHLACGRRNKNKRVIYYGAEFRPSGRDLSSGFHPTRLITIVMLNSYHSPAVVAPNTVYLSDLIINVLVIVHRQIKDFWPSPQNKQSVHACESEIYSPDAHAQVSVYKQGCFNRICILFSCFA